MSSEDFQLIDNEPIDDSIIKRDYLKVYHQQGANLNDSNQNVAIIFGQKIIIIHKLANWYCSS